MLFRNTLPALPGLSINKKIGCERWHKSSQFDYYKGQVPCLVERRRPQTAGNPPFPCHPNWLNFSSLYPQKENCELPSWVIYDKQILCFDAYYTDRFEDSMSPFKERKVKIYFYLEDGTIQVNEEKIENCGFTQGTLFGRRRIPFPEPLEKAYYELIDLNIGRTVEFFARRFKIVNCDTFTRQWLNRAGIPVPDPIEIPDNREKEKSREAINSETKPRYDKLGQFLKYDGYVLRFYGYWDDRQAGGYIHKLIVQYYLSDDTIDVKREKGEILLKRTRLVKEEQSPEFAAPDVNLLNVLCTGYLKGRVVKDAKNVGAVNVKYYTDADLLPGVTINVYGRAVVLCGCDKFTEDYYRAKYGVDNFKYESIPVDLPTEQRTSRELPPWNGFGTFEDSAGNCLSLIPKPFHKNARRVLMTSDGLDSNILRFRARLISDILLDQHRSFLISFYLTDDTTSVFELAARNSGFEQRMFIKRKEAFKPRKTVYVSKKPEIYSKEDFWVGNVLEIDNYRFELLEADEYTLRYMEINSQEFPKSNIDLILDKIRKKLRENNYKKFVQELLPGDGGAISKSKMCEALKNLMGADITPQEIITTARNFALEENKGLFNKSLLRDVCRNECRRLLFSGFDRLKENLLQEDTMQTGYLPKSTAYGLCRAARIPIDFAVMQTVLDEVEKNERGDVNINDLLSFFDPKQNATAAIVPFNQLRVFGEFRRRKAEPSEDLVNLMKLIQSLGLEEDLKKET